MSRNGTANLILVGLAVIGAFVVVPPLLNLAGGLLGLVFTLLFWMLVGYISGKLVSGKSFGTLGDIVMGLIGGFVGNIILGLFGVNLGGIIGAVVTGVIGAVVLVCAVRFLGNREFGR
ncbi:MAG: GlsB/YeaQ/YmgE family stress response membrane protein [Anaerolineae bacterium]